MKRAMARRITIGPKRKGDKPQTREGLRRVIVQTLPMDDAELLDQASEEIERALADYRTLKAANDAQLTARQARVWLKRGTQLLNRLERWLIDVEPTVVRDYVLSGARSLAAKRRRSELMRPMWNEKLSEIHLWQDRFNQSLLFVRTDRGKPENFPLKQLVRDLAKIWEKSPPSRSPIPGRGSSGRGTLSSPSARRSSLSPRRLRSKPPCDML